MPLRIAGLVTALNRAWPEAESALEALAAKLKDPTRPELSPAVVNKYDRFRVSVLELTEALKVPDSALAQVAAETKRL